MGLSLMPQVTHSTVICQMAWVSLGDRSSGTEIPILHCQPLKEEQPWLDTLVHCPTC